MKANILFSLALAPTLSFSDSSSDCSKIDNWRENIIEISEFNCESKIDCSVGILAPAKLEGYPLLGLSAILNYRNPNDFDMLVNLSSESSGDDERAFIYGTLQTLENVKIFAAYQTDIIDCPLRSVVQLKYNKRL